MTPRFLTVEDVKFLHGESIRLYGGSHGVRDKALLDSAVNQPLQTFDGKFLYPELADMAGVYWYSIVLNHPFVDGNKRTSLRAAYVFLAINGLELHITNADAIRLTLGVISRTISREDLSMIIADRTVRLP